MENERESGVKPKEIAFGMVFENVSGGETSRHVVVDPGKKKIFYTSRIAKINGEMVLWFPGSNTLKDVTRTTDERWTKEQILAAYENYFSPVGGTPEYIVERITHCSTRRPRKIT
jgi:hypothetical protein